MDNLCMIAAAERAYLYARTFVLSISESIPAAMNSLLSPLTALKEESFTVLLSC